MTNRTPKPQKTGRVFRVVSDKDGNIDVVPLHMVQTYLGS